MKTFIFLPSDTDALGDGPSTPDDFVKLVKFHSIVAKTKEPPKGALMQTFESQVQSETTGDEVVKWCFPDPEEEPAVWPYDKATISLMNNPYPVRPRMTS